MFLNLSLRFLRLRESGVSYAVLTNLTLTRTWAANQLATYFETDNPIHALLPATVAHVMRSNGMHRPYLAKRGQIYEPI